MISESTLVRDIAMERPGATAVFRRHKIDFCCNGGVPLAQAAAGRGVPYEVIARELQELAPGDIEIPSEPRPLIEHILERYHEVHRRDFPEAIRLARRVEAVHREKESCPHGLADHLTWMIDELEAHQQKEEGVLFPMMLQGGSPMIRFPIERMMSEHEDVAEQLETLARLTGDFTPPPEACTTWRALFQACRKIDEDLREHMHLENNLLFPQFAPSAA